MLAVIASQFPDVDASHAHAPNPLRSHIGVTTVHVHVDEHLQLGFVLTPFSPAPVDHGRTWYTIADRLADDFPLASMFRYAP